MDAVNVTQPSAHDLMPLDMAASMVFRRVYEKRMLLGMRASPTRHLDALAYTIVELVAVYLYDTDGRSLRRISDHELSGALFQDGARSISYLDGRTPITNLAVSVKDVNAVIQKLMAAFRFGDEAP